MARCWGFFGCHGAVRVTFGGTLAAHSQKMSSLTFVHCFPELYALDGRGGAFWIMPAFSDAGFVNDAFPFNVELGEQYPLVKVKSLHNDCAHAKHNQSVGFLQPLQ